MGIEEKIVCDEKGQITAAWGALCPVRDNPYSFYAGTPVENGSMVDNRSNITVKMVLPVGGDASGLYRFPRVGEKVLVEVGGGSSSPNYLLGYVPEKTDGMAFTPAKEPTGNERNDMTGEGEGFIFRYKNTAARPDNAEKGIKDRKYSEIGFYRRIDDKEDADKRRIPDELKISSAGASVQEAEYFHAIRAKGIEIFSGLDPSTVNVPGDESGRPVGNVRGEDYMLGSADIQMRAGGEIVIKAAEKITLQVGRSRITIDDRGINLTSKKVNSLYTNTFDTFINLNPRTGISMFGQTVGITAGNSLTVGDSYGGVFASSAGVVNVNGREVAVNTYDIISYFALIGINAIDCGFNTGLINAARQGWDPTGKVNAENLKVIQEFTKKLSLTLSKLFKVGKTFFKSTDFGKEKHHDWDRQKLMYYMNTALRAAEAAQGFNRYAFDATWGRYLVDQRNSIPATPFVRR